MTRAAYPSDLTDAEWAVLEEFFPTPPPGPKERKYSRREVVNAIRYKQRTGCQWQYLPHDFPPWKVTVQAPHASIVLQVLRAKYRQKRNGHTARGQAVKIHEDARGSSSVTVQPPSMRLGVPDALRAKYRQKRNGHTARGQASGLCATERRGAGTASAWPTRWAQIHHRRRISIRALDRCTLRSIMSAKRVSIEGAA